MDTKKLHDMIDAKDTGSKFLHALVELIGRSGERGEKGDAGERGEKGDAGQRGEKGDAGQRGEKGDAGERGEKGDEIVGPPVEEIPARKTRS